MENTNTLNPRSISKFSTLDLVETALYAALIYLGIAFFRIQLGEQMAHFANALVVLGVLCLGSVKGAVAGSIGLYIFDMTHGWAASAPTTVIETLLVCLVLALVYEKIMKRNDKMSNIILVGVIAAITKIILNLLKYTFYKGMFLKGFTFAAARVYAVTKVTGSFACAALTVILVPILYPIFKKVLIQLKRM